VSHTPSLTKTLEKDHYIEEHYSDKKQQYGRAGLHSPTLSLTHSHSHTRSLSLLLLLQLALETPELQSKEQSQQ
jgi:hypothetical protein